MTFAPEVSIQDLCELLNERLCQHFFFFFFKSFLNGVCATFSSSPSNRFFFLPHPEAQAEPVGVPSDVTLETVGEHTNQTLSLRWFDSEERSGQRPKGEQLL